MSAIKKIKKFLKGLEELHGRDIVYFKKKAERGDAEAQFNLGYIYANGKGIPKDHVEAYRWYKMAADQGLAEAESIIAIKYADGKGVKQDDAEALRWFQRAADHGHLDSQFLRECCMRKTTEASRAMRKLLRVTAKPQNKAMWTYNFCLPYCLLMVKASNRTTRKP